MNETTSHSPVSQAERSSARSAHPWLASLLLRRGRMLLPRFAAHYRSLASLPRRIRRRLLRRAAVGLTGAALLLALGHTPSAVQVAHAATIAVDGVNCTLVDAILSAENDASYGGCTAGSGADTIDLQADVTLTMPFGSFYYYNTGNRITGLPLVKTTITIEGNGHVIERDTDIATPKFPVLSVGIGNLTINDTTISGGYSSAVFNYDGNLTITNSTISDNSAVDGALSGAVHNMYGDVMITSSTISDNLHLGVYNEHGEITITNSTISGNYSGAKNGYGELTITNSIISSNGGGVGSYRGIMTIANSTISGNGSGVGTGDSEVVITNSTISGNNSRGVSNRGSNVTIGDSTISGNNGGGVDNGPYSSMTITNSTISGNSAGGGGGVVSWGYSSLTIINSTISDNTTGPTPYGSGGGLYIEQSDVTIINSTISGNSANEGGGGVHIRSNAEVMIIGSTISGNSGLGGGITNINSTVMLINSTISGNETTYHDGGGVFNWDGDVTITNSTITDNTADRYGGGVFHGSGASTTFNRSVISGNNGSEVYVFNSNSDVYTDNYNLFGHGGISDAQAFVNFAPGLNDINATSDGDNVPLADILETTLADNGGPLSGAPGLEEPLLTHALVAGSPAIDAAPSAACVAPDLDQDQRGLPRNVDGDGSGDLAGTECDLGAYERQPADGDNDGVDSDVEDGAPNNGDGNDDGTPDSEQGNVSSLPNSIDGDYVTLAAPAGTQLSDVNALDNPSPGDTPANVDFPIGFLDFQVENVTPGGTVVVEVFLVNGATVNTYYKYGPTPDNPTNHWYEFLDDDTTGAEFLSDRILLHFVDGQRGDADLASNGVITDPGAPAQGPPAATVYVTTTAAGTTADSLSFDTRDILKWDGTAWSLLFDGSAHGLSNAHNANAVHVNTANDLYLNFLKASVVVPGAGTVKAQDIVRWNGSAFSLLFDGSDVGLSTTSEKIDALHVLDGSVSPIGTGCAAYLLISTTGAGRVPAFGGGVVKFNGEDILGFCATNTGAVTTGSWHMVLDGSAEGMPKNSTDSISASDDGTVFYLTTKGAFNVDSATGSHSMVYKFDTTTDMFSGPFFNAPANGLSQKMDGLHVEGDLP